MSGHGNSKKLLNVGLGMLIAFVIVLVIIFMPVFGGKNGLDYLDNLYNAISKASAYYIPDLMEEGESFKGKKIEAVLKLKDEDEAAHAAILFSAAGAEAVPKGSELKIVFESLPTPDDPKVRRPDITRAREILGWEPQIGRREGLELTLAYFKKDLAGRTT